MPPFRLREAAPADAEAIALLHTDSWRRHYRGAYSDSFLDGDILDDRRSVWSDRLAKPSHSATIVATAAGSVTAFVHVIFDADDQWGSLVDNLHVALVQQRRGVGRALLARAAAAVVERAGSRTVHLWVLEQNTAAQRFYSALGGTNVETTLADEPGGTPGRLNGSPKKLRIAWTDASTLCG